MVTNDGLADISHLTPSFASAQDAAHAAIATRADDDHSMREIAAVPVLSAPHQGVRRRVSTRLAVPLETLSRESVNALEIADRDEAGSLGSQHFEWSHTVDAEPDAGVWNLDSARGRRADFMRDHSPAACVRLWHHVVVRFAKRL
jgi:hypothetical protein